VLPQGRGSVDQRRIDAQEESSPATVSRASPYGRRLMAKKKAAKPKAKAKGKKKGGAKAAAY
jgi:hypothetical protein